MENPFLIKKYPDLAGSKPVESAVKKARKSGAKIHDNAERVGAYMERLEKIADSERGFGKLKSMVLNRFTLDTQDEDSMNKIAEGLYESEKRILIEQGRGREIERLESEPDVAGMYRSLIEEKAEIQRKTLTDWLDYLQENDAKQSTQFRYFVVRSLGKMGMLDKENITYSKRTGATVAPFPELNSEALGWVYKRFSEGVSPEDVEDEKKRKEVERLIEKKDFAKLYAFAQIETAGHLNRETIEGDWKKYDQGSDYHLLEKDLKGKGTGWCTAEGSAQSHLEDGDFYVYYTKGSSGAYTEPRVALRMEGKRLAEVRGVNPRQELELELVDIAQKKYHNLPEGDKFDKKAADMKRMTAIVKKTEKQEPLSIDDLRFLYEFDAPIRGFGLGPDPRIEVLTNHRDFKKDMAGIYSCAQDDSEIARALMDDGRIHVVIHHFRDLQKLDQRAIAHRLIDDGMVTSKLLRNFEGLDQTIATKLIDAGQEKLVARNLIRFQGLNQATADKFIDVGSGHALANHIDRFQGLDHRAIANRLMVAGETTAFAMSLRYFRGLDQGIASRLIDEGRGDFVASNIDSFQDIDQLAIVTKLANRGHWRSIDRNLEKFQGLDQGFIDARRSLYIDDETRRRDERS